MVTDAQNKANLGSASNVAAQSIGLDHTQAASWSQDEKIAYTQALARTILQYPQSFTDATLALANKLLGFTIDETPEASPDTVFDSADWSYFGLELENNMVNAGTKLEEAGNGVLDAIAGLGGSLGNSARAIQNTTAVAQWILPIGAVVMLWWLFKDPEKSTRATANLSGAVREYFPY